MDFRWYWLYPLGQVKSWIFIQKHFQNPLGKNGRGFPFYSETWRAFWTFYVIILFAILNYLQIKCWDWTTLKECRVFIGHFENFPHDGNSEFNILFAMLNYLYMFKFLGERNTLDIQRSFDFHLKKRRRFQVHIFICHHLRCTPI